MQSAAFTARQLTDLFALVGALKVKAAQISACGHLKAANRNEISTV